MKTLYKKALTAYTELLELHIDSKTTDTLFHKETEVFYETLFEVAHKLWEKHVDLWGNLLDLSIQEKRNKANEIITSLRKDLEEYSKEKNISLWTEDLIWSLANILEDIEWTSKWFVVK